MSVIPPELAHYFETIDRWAKTSRQKVPAVQQSSHRNVGFGPWIVPHEFDEDFGAFCREKRIGVRRTRLRKHPELSAFYLL
jgi:hypothetical protein